jgi:hypothetical protein
MTFVSQQCVHGVHFLTLSFPNARENPSPYVYRHFLCGLSTSELVGLSLSQADDASLRKIPFGKHTSEQLIQNRDLAESSTIKSYAILAMILN